MTRWQYAEVNISDGIEELNEAGDDGWELVAVVAEPATHDLQAAIVAYLKRELVSK